MLFEEAFKELIGGKLLVEAMRRVVAEPGAEIELLRVSLTSTSRGEFAFEFAALLLLLEEDLMKSLVSVGRLGVEAALMKVAEEL